MNKKILKHLTIATLAIAAIAGTDGIAHAETATYQTEVNPSINVTIPVDLIEVVVDPSNQPFDSAPFSISVSTNNATGYYMTMNSNSTSLLKTNNNTITIPTLSDNEDGYTDETFETNKWGYKIGTGNYIPFVSGARIAGADEPTNSDSTNLAFAAKVNFLQPSGVYKGILEFFAVANPLPIIMQDLDMNMCTAEPMIVVDNRDNQEYTIQKLADGNCWMMNNLNLGATELATDLNNRNTNILNTISAADFNSWKSTEWVGTSDGYEFMPIEGTDPIANEKYGTKYNYNVATMGGDTDATEYDISTSICPHGWRLPTAKEEDILRKKYEDKTIEEWRAPISEGGLAFALPEDYVYYLSSSDKGYYLGWRPAFQVSETGVSSSNTSSSDGGYIRCVIKTDYKSLSDITSMQEMNKDIVINTPNGTTKILTDTRDDKTYTVRKIKNIIWMIQNLRFTGTEINPTTTNIDTAKTLTYHQLDSDECKLAEDGTGGMYNLCIKEGVDDGGNPTVWYNYAAASAGTITGDSMDETRYSVCPSGWSILDGVSRDDMDVFSPVGGGIYRDGVLMADSWIGFWWGGTTNTYNGYKYGMVYGYSSYTNNYWMMVDMDSQLPRHNGAYIRCSAPNYTP